MFESLVTEDTVESHVYRKARRVTTALTASDYRAWRDGYCPDDLGQWFAQNISEGYDLYSYQRFLYQIFWKHHCGDERCDPVIRAAVTQATLVSTIDWCNTDYRVDVGD